MEILVAEDDARMASLLERGLTAEGHRVFVASDGREALDFEGSHYAGIISRIFEGLPFADMEPNWDYTYGGRNLVVPGKLMIKYLEQGGGFSVISSQVPRKYRIVDPRSGETVGRGKLAESTRVETQTTDPRVVIFVDEAHRAAQVLHQ